MMVSLNPFEAEAMHAWDTAAPAWTSLVRTPGSDPYRTLALLPAVFDLLGSVDGKTVLDAGCGEGSLARMLAERGAHVTGVDVSAAQLHAAELAETGSPHGITYLQRSVTDLEGLANEYFQVILANQLLVSVAAYARALQELARVLAVRGRLVVSILHPCFRGPGAGWVQGPYGPRWHHDRYLHQLSSHVQIGQPNGVQLPVYHRPLSDYLSAACAAGLLLCGFREPVVPEWSAPQASAAVGPEHCTPQMAVMGFTKR